ncbi:Conserved oligomeric Golgi complex subunit 1 isoform 1 [Schistosoma japonicum]|uniref:Conserved oligomeric Golgi complex subunit 1 n=1 Tax=Schistosoma japonicum TaxID=6182 RepID=A0A4Z2DDD8_SCHJA|nr:Conserved oligomeric Golgi complex subunit 1 isoform 1 [Schistosoma japonicum]
MVDERLKTVEGLLSINTVDELHRIVRQKRAEVEHKKDELRHLVGERHRDIIDASDRILLMKHLTHEISVSLDQLRSCLATWNQDVETANDASAQTHSHKLSIASQLKLMLDIPELIWNYMDLGLHTSSARMFFLGRHLNARLSLSRETQLSHVDANVLISRAWDSLVHMEAAVISACRKRLCAPLSTKEELCDSLTALLMLNDLPLLQVLEEFFNGRKVGLYCLLGRHCLPHHETIELKPNFILSARKQISVVVRHILSTLEYLEFLFLSSTNDKASTYKGALISRISFFGNWIFQDSSTFSKDRLYTYLPIDVLNFKLKSFRFSDDFSDFKQDEKCNLLIDLLRESWGAWRNNAIQICREVLSESLSHISCFETLVDIRTSILILVRRLQTHSSSFRNTTESDTKKINIGFIKFDIWIELLRDLFLQRLKILFTDSFKNCFNEWIAQFDQILVMNSKSKSENNLSRLLSFNKPFLNNPIEHSRVDWANFVWSDCLKDINMNHSSVTQESVFIEVPKFEETSGSSISAWNNEILFHLVKSNNVGLAVFCCLSHLPIPDSFDLIEDGNDQDLTSSAQLVFLQRLVSENAQLLSGIKLNGYTDLQKKLHILLPEFLSLCDKLNFVISNHVIKLTLNVGQDSLDIWSLVFTALQSSLTQLAKWITNKAYGIQSLESDCSNTSVSLKISPSCGFLLSRAWYTLVECCPSIIAALVAATGQTESIYPVHSAMKNPNPPGDSVENTLLVEGLVWTNISLLRCKWESLSHSLFELVNQITFDSLVKATIGHTILEEFHDSLRSTFLLNSKQSDDEFKNDMKLDLVFDRNTVESLLARYSNTDAMYRSIIPFENVRLELDSSEPMEDVDGDSVTVISIPSQLSLPTHHLLLNIVYTMGKTLVHKSLQSPFSHRFLYSLCTSLFEVYSKIVCELLSFRDTPDSSTKDVSLLFSDSLQKLLQSRALQIIFDLKFLRHLLISSVSIIESSPIQVK